MLCACWYCGVGGTESGTSRDSTFETTSSGTNAYARELYTKLLLLLLGLLFKQRKLIELVNKREAAYLLE